MNAIKHFNLQKKKLSPTVSEKKIFKTYYELTN